MKTREEIEAMGDEERRVKTAELCGWTMIKTYDDEGVPFSVGYPPDKQGREESRESQCDPQIPNYLDSLDAMGEAEKRVRDMRLYADTLQDVCENHPVGRLPDWQEDLLRLFYVAHSSARQRNCAFLMTML